MTFKESPGSSDSKLTEFEVIVRFVCLANSSSDPNIDCIDLPTHKDSGETKEKFVSRVTKNAQYTESEVWDMISSNEDPDFVGNHNGKPFHAEVKGGNKVPNNTAHEMGYVLMKNIKLESSMESSIVIPEDRAVKFRNRLTNKSESTKDKAGLDGYIEGMDAISKNLDIEYRIYIVWNDVKELGLKEFLESEYENFDEERSDLEEVKSLDSI